MCSHFYEKNCELVFVLTMFFCSWCLLAVKWFLIIMKYVLCVFLCAWLYRPFFSLLGFVNTREIRRLIISPFICNLPMLLFLEHCITPLGWYSVIILLRKYNVCYQSRMGVFLFNILILRLSNKRKSILFSLFRFFSFLTCTIFFNWTARNHMANDRYSKYFFSLLEFVLNCKCRTKVGVSLKNIV